MSLVFAGVCSHAPGITGRAKRADPRLRDAFYAKLGELRARLEAAEPDALIVIAAEHFANFFMNNMPAYCVGMADGYEGPIEDEQWLGIARRAVPRNADFSRRVIGALLEPSSTTTISTSTGKLVERSSFRAWPTRSRSL